MLVPIVAAALFAAEQPAPPSVARPVDPSGTRAALGLTRYPSKVSGITVAVLDSGFAGVSLDRPYLPKSATLIEQYDPHWVRKHGLGDPSYLKPFVVGEAHGRQLAQLVWAATGNHPDGPKFLLLNANGPTLFRRAIRYAIEQKADIILFGGTFEGAGNYDGRGPVNAAVSEAVAAGILWVNAAGNCGGAVYDGPVEIGPNGYLQFAGRTSALRVRNRLDENPLTLTLTWTDYREQEDAGTDKDLDLFVEDVTGRVLAQSTLTQVVGRVAGAGETANPRERLVLSAGPATPPGWEYRVRVRWKTGTFRVGDRLRLHVASARQSPLPDPKTGQPVAPVELLDATRRHEIYPPADHPGVLTVGDDNPASAVGPTTDGRPKPDVNFGLSVARFTSGEETAGTSNAAAYFAGVLTVLKANCPRLTTAQVREWVRRLDTTGHDRQPVWNTTVWGVYKPTGRTGRTNEPSLGRRTPHVVWRTPTPDELAALVAGG